MPISEGLLNNLKVDPARAETLTALDMGDRDITNETAIEIINNFSSLKYITLHSSVINKNTIEAILAHNKLEKVVILNEEALTVGLELIYDMCRHLSANNKKSAAQNRIEQIVFVKNIVSESFSQQLANLSLHKKSTFPGLKNHVNQENYSETNFSISGVG